MEGIGGFLFVAWIGLAWLTHVITCIAASKWVFLLAGAVFFPIGCVHGTGVWFGFF
jgi:predicted membrane channel-forming protein YqfA (hemolysin III family)